MDSQSAPVPKIKKVVLPAITFLGALAGYSLTFARTVTLTDSGELILASATLGIPHPPGFPLYVMLGHLFTKLPFGTIPARVSFMSSFFAALTAAVLTLIALEVHAVLREDRARSAELKKSRDNNDVKAKRESTEDARHPLERIFGWVMPVSVGLTFAYSMTFWFYAAVVEVYTLNVFLFAVIVYLMLGWHRASSSHRGTPKQARWRLPVAGLLYGLALGVHHVSMLLALPAFVWLVWRRAGHRFFFSREVGLTWVGAVIGLSAYLYLPIAAAYEPIYNFGDPSTWQGFYRHVTGKIFQSNLFSSNLTEEIVYFVGILYRQFTLIGTVCAIGGFWVLRQQHEQLFRTLALVVFFAVGFSLTYKMGADKDAYYLTTFFVLAISLVALAKHLSDWSAARRGPLRIAVFILFAALPLTNFAAHFFENNKSRDTIARDYVENTMRTVELGGLLLTGDWQFYSPYLYMRHVEGFRRDAIVVMPRTMTQSWYLDGYLRREYPDMMQACAVEAQALLEDVKAVEAGTLDTDMGLGSRVVALTNAFIKYQNPTRGVHTMLDMYQGIGFGSNDTWVPEGLTLRLYAEKPVPYKPIHPLQLRGLLDGTLALDERARVDVRPTYARMMALRGKYLNEIGRFDEALDYLQLAVQLDPQFEQNYIYLGEAYAGEGKANEAVQAYQKALKLNPTNNLVRRRLQQLGQ